MSRSKWKGVFIAKNILKRPIKKNIKIWSRTSTITSAYLNKRVFIHTGNYFRLAQINKNHIGLKFGEFAFTRKKRTKKFLKKKQKK
jgi:small subunit ribosomal protein S19